jgi:hypothetical protein
LPAVAAFLAATERALLEATFIIISSVCLLVDRSVCCLLFVVVVVGFGCVCCRSMK